MILKSKWLLIIIIVGVGWLSLSSIKIKLHSDIVNKEVADIEKKIQDLEKENGVLEKFIEYVKNPLFLEKEARLKLNYRASGETVVFVYPDEADTVASDLVDFKKQLAQMPNYVKWGYYLLGH
ncbi:MAG: hypothetical protein A3B91_03440 [Candidatus Yanofskybacteria bacterium RIFCSPHIGHO2_02_FULL_41_29]|uniref:Septum formation initiator n=1 Tax=Candidatus Yanofskybacteria bacterium RIFCSPHIGHO2_01_FULL_41_53 TaxID=1802663 RepID=A0A1F8EGR6_9BACT|nr:MAG: hypothetical protein A2650_01265 [Candidatus Yanofskybacteria bacterium RIFCSPHIGHO2_01_FULL_41_53]OGN10711.1 MAG: hypothetical protein A3B91_03440 [Candidatus Yanofskybacteria bacterium RIFCSPHIGHO2_02_FULL_41_29]OGN17582.1 MAG: hypothetical protein A3F48_04450 [Candidatus Yanofskybacteria bacterium RIFCSPHIGHO2_12_FULL_41_9]OGN24031.1 MAG: hypothetical protein A2916_04690 [Candidatus Yanofskybacteria bacterium RIFCSPLOWO2_01_FULL_41_67]OGN30509.1 MAG: hypothetical protein A3H54_00610 